jgi:septal ring factor EnvC (AmiA/AmiB activator)
MKELLLSIITKTLNYTKCVAIKIVKMIEEIIDYISLEGRKSQVIRSMYNPSMEKRRREEAALAVELNKLREEKEKLNRQISDVARDNSIYQKKINALKAFRIFLLDNNCK